MLWFDRSGENFVADFDDLRARSYVDVSPY